MKTYLKFASIPLVLFLVFFGIPRLFATLFNAHSDLGIVAIVVIVCAIVSAVGTKIYNGYLEKDSNENEN